MSEPATATPVATEPSNQRVVVPDDVTAKAVENARREERTKLYKEIEGLKAQIAALENKPTTTTADEKALVKYEQMLVLMEQKYEAKLSEERTAREKLEVDLYRASKVHQLQSSKVGFIEKMITGSTKAEIDAAIEESKKAFAEAFQQAEAELATRTRTTPPAAGPASGPTTATPSSPANPPTSADDPDGMTADQIDAMDPQEYAKHRQKILARMGVKTPSI